MNFLKKIKDKIGDYVRFNMLYIYIFDQRKEYKPKPKIEIQLIEVQKNHEITSLITFRDDKTLNNILRFFASQKFYALLA